MSHKNKTNTRQMVAVVATVEEWSSFKSLLQGDSGDDSHQLTFISVGSNEVCDMSVHGRSVSLYNVDLEQDMTEDSISHAIEGCFKFCIGGISAFVLLIQGGCYTKRERKIVEILQVHFGAEALKYLVILSLEDGKVVDTLDDSLMELINTCEGRYCRITSSAVSDKMCALLEMIDHMLIEHRATGYTETMLAEARKRSTEDSAMKMLKQKVQDAEGKEQAFKQLVQQQEERRVKEVEELKAKHAEERQKEAAEKMKYQTKRESLEEAMISHKAMLQLQMSATDDDETKKMSVILLGLSGSGKSSALKWILERACNQYSMNEYSPPQPTLACERKEVTAAGRRLILVDTPELWDEDGTENLKLVKDCLALSQPGPHIFLLVLQVGRFTQGESEMLGHLQKIFGREFVEHAMVLFVHFDGNQHRPQRISDYVAGAHSALQDLMRKCGSRYYELSVTKFQNALSYPQVKDLLLGMNKLVASHGGHSYSVRRFTVQELQDRKRMMEEGKEGMMEVNFLLKEA